MIRRTHDQAHGPIWDPKVAPWARKHKTHTVETFIKKDWTKNILSGDCYHGRMGAVSVGDNFSWAGTLIPVMRCTITQYENYSLVNLSINMLKMRSINHEKQIQNWRKKHAFGPSSQKNREKFDNCGIWTHATFVTSTWSWRLNRSAKLSQLDIMQ